MSVVIPKSLVVSRASTELRYYPWLGWQNQVAFGNVLADFQSDLFPASALSTSASTIYWVSTSLATQYLTVINLDGSIDYMGIARHNFAGMTLSIEAITAVSSPAYVEIVPDFTPADNSPILVRFEKDSYTSVRLKIAGATVFPQAAVLYVGELTIIPQGIEPGYTPIRDGQDVQLAVGRSTVGEFLGSIVEGMTLSTSTPFNRLPRTWYETYMRPFIDAANLGVPFFFAWSPVLRPDDVGFCWFTGSSRPVITTSQSHYKAEMPMGGLAL